MAKAGPSAITIREDFASNPSNNGWKVWGNPSLFQWNKELECLDVTWDSSETNSYFYYSLNTELTKKDSFSLEFELQVFEAIAGTSSNKPFTFELSLGLINLNNATNSGFHRGTASSSPNLVEFDYFPDSGYGATVSPTIISDRSRFYPSFAFPFELLATSVYQVRLDYESTNMTLRTVITENGKPTQPIDSVKLPSDFSDFMVNAVSINNYSDEGAGGSIKAFGRVDNIQIHLPSVPSVQLHGQKIREHFQVTFTGQPGAFNQIERSVDLKTWTKVFEILLTTERQISYEAVLENNSPAFYRVKIESQ